MRLVDQYRSARHSEDVARLRRLLALRAMAASGLSQRRIAEALGVTQPAVSQQLASTRALSELHPEVLLEAAWPVLAALASEHGFSRLAVFGSVARHEARQDSDIDLVVEAPAGASTFDFLRFQHLIEQVLDRPVDLIDYGGLKPRIDDDIRREAVLL